MSAVTEIQEANDRTTEMTPEMACLEKIGQKGYTEQFKTDGEAIVSDGSDNSYQPTDINVINFYRFEGVSDPDDMSIIYVIETTDGHKGTLMDAYGVYADETVTDFMNKVEQFTKQTERGWS